MGTASHTPIRQTLKPSNSQTLKLSNRLGSRLDVSRAEVDDDQPVRRESIQFENHLGWITGKRSRRAERSVQAALRHDPPAIVVVRDVHDLDHAALRRR